MKSNLVKPFFSSYSFIRVFSTFGSKVLRQGHDYNFSVSAESLKKTLVVEFQLFGTNDDNDYYEFNILQEKVSNELKNYVINVSALKPKSILIVKYFLDIVYRPKS